VTRSVDVTVTLLLAPVALEETSVAFDVPFQVMVVMGKGGRAEDGPQILAALHLENPDARYVTLMFSSSTHAAILQALASTIFSDTQDCADVRHVVSPVSPSAPLWRDLTRREREVLRLLSCGLRNKEIAAELGIAEATVEVHAKKMFKKLGVRDRTAAVIAGLRRGYIDL
jgi:DNA-binding CsgD family transcriptional regulator